MAEAMAWFVALPLAQQIAIGACSVVGYVVVAALTEKLLTSHADCRVSVGNGMECGDSDFNSWTLRCQPCGARWKATVWGWLWPLGVVCFAVRGTALGCYYPLRATYRLVRGPVSDGR